MTTKWNIQRVCGACAASRLASPVRASVDWVHYVSTPAATETVNDSFVIFRIEGPPAIIEKSYYQQKKWLKMALCESIALVSRCWQFEKLKSVSNGICSCSLNNQSTAWFYRIFRRRRNRWLHRITNKNDDNKIPRRRLLFRSRSQNKLGVFF